MTVQFARERRSFIARSAGVAAAIAGAVWPLRHARAAEFNMKLATTIPPDHPLNAHARAAAAAIAQQSGGRVNIEVFPGYVLGSSTSALSQLRGGGIQLLTLSGSVLSTLVPTATIYNTAFAFKDYDQVWSAMDGALGDHIRAKVSAIGLQPIGKHWDLGFRHVTTSARPIRTPEDMRDLKLRVPVAPLFVSCFKALGSAPTPLNFDEVYSALQTKLIDGQENDVIVTDTAKLYEVQKYCALTGHIWDGYFTLANGRMWKGLPESLQEIVSRNFAEAAVKERAEIRARSQDVRKQLQDKGMVFNDVDRDAFRAALRKAGFYAQWKETFGAEAWAALEKATGPL
jgi:tripartite ATP-independent transporter DctP family solute receptor